MRLRADRIGKAAPGPGPGAQQLARIAVDRRREGVEIEIVGRAGAPALKPRTLFERAVAIAQEIGLRDPDPLQRPPHRRPGALADADRRNVGGLDQGHLKRRHRTGIGARGDQAGRKPPGGTPADDHDSGDSTLHPGPFPRPTSGTLLALKGKSHPLARVTFPSPHHPRD